MVKQLGRVHCREGLDDAYAVTTRVSAWCPRRTGRTTISTSLPRALRNRKSRSVENPSSLPRMRAETFGWSMPSSFAAFT